MVARLWFFMFFSFATLFISCERITPANNSSEQKLGTVTLANSFYKRFEGKAGNHIIIMNMTRLDTTLMGNYQFDSQQPVSFSFNSKIDKNGLFIIKAESTANNNVNNSGHGTITGKFISEKEIKGSWTSYDKKEKYNLGLFENYPNGSAEFSTVYYHKKIAQGEPNKEGLAEITILHPKMKNFADDYLKKIINKYLTTKLLNNYSYSKSAAPYITYDEMMNDFFRRYRDEIKFSKKIKIERDIYFSNFYEIYVIYNSYNIISIQEIVSTYEGGAHPLTNYNFKNFDLLNGKEIKLNDVLLGNYMPELTKIAENRFRRLFNIPVNQDLKKAGFFFNKGIFELNDNYSFSNYGITFQFNPYEVAAYVYGAPEITIPYSEIKNLIKPVSILGKFLK
jgi:Protein of unknown function (DUF3298)/Deacetylase PdaC